MTGLGIQGHVGIDDQGPWTPPEPNQFVAEVGVPFHVAVVWDIDGIDGSSDKVRMYRNGSVVGSTSASWNTVGPVQDDIILGYGPDGGGYDKFISDNLKIWDYAKTDFSDRFEEGYNNPPVADANGPYIVPATSWQGAWVTLDGGASYDPDGDSLTYSWNIGNEVIGNTAVLEYQFPIDGTYVSLTVTDSFGESDTDTTTVTVTLMDVDIDIKPGSYPNSINLGSHGVVPVAFLTTENFDATTIDPYTVTLVGKDFSGLVKLRGKKQEPMSDLEDIDGDGDLDLVVHLLTENLDLEPGAVICVLGALTYDGLVVQGEDSVNIVPGD